MDDCLPLRAVVSDDDLQQRSASAAGEQAVPGCAAGLGWERVDPHVPGCPLLFRVVAAAYERRALGIASHWPFESWGRFLPEHTTAVSLLDRPTACAKPGPKEEPS